MKILAIESERPNAPEEAFTTKLLREEALTVWKLYLKGIVRELYFRGDREEAILVLECDTMKEANKAIASLPLVKRSLITFELIPLVAYPGFERLFSKT
ncbi:MAG TPA: superoxide dismutase [Bacteroidota bacterium]|nr:superoxide dismutase [Bacteroidota bacterium]